MPLSSHLATLCLGSRRIAPPFAYGSAYRVLRRGASGTSIDFRVWHLAGVRCAPGGFYPARRPDALLGLRLFRVLRSPSLVIRLRLASSRELSSRRPCHPPKGTTSPWRWLFGVSIDSAAGPGALTPGPALMRFLTSSDLSNVWSFAGPGSFFHLETRATSPRTADPIWTVRTPYRSPPRGGVGRGPFRRPTSVTHASDGRSRDRVIPFASPEVASAGSGTAALTRSPRQAEVSSLLAVCPEGRPRSKRRSELSRDHALPQRFRRDGIALSVRRSLFTLSSGRFVVTAIARHGRRRPES
jgi:hypothetical protein